MHDAQDLQAQRIQLETIRNNFSDEILLEITRNETYNNDEDECISSTNEYKESLAIQSYLYNTKFKYKVVRNIAGFRYNIFVDKPDADNALEIIAKHLDEHI
jgi:hypothetical protein